MISGIVKFDKPSGWTSFDVVNKVRNTLEKGMREETGLRTRLKVGHSGTLDPFATGLLLLAFGKCTKQLEKLTKQDKTYEGVMVLDAASTTGDIEGGIVKLVKPIHPEQAELEHAMKGFVGAITQTPPIFSAIKVGGVRAYKLARAGEEPEMRPRHVRVARLKLKKYHYPRVTFVVTVSSGTYIRSLVEDIAESIHSRAYLEKLRRTDIQGTGVEGSLDPESATYEEILTNSEKCT